jgi:hypothetical protein
VTLLLLRAGAQVPGSCPSRGDSLLSLATQDSNPDVVRALISKGAPVNCRDEHGRTALYWAAVNGESANSHRRPLRYFFRIAFGCYACLGFMPNRSRSYCITVQLALS